MKFAIGSLFSGIGGLDLGLEAATGGRVVWLCESDRYARSVLARHWPGVPCYEDVRDLDATTPPIDLLAGGFPCQDLSCAGKGAGLGEARSGLWREFARLIRVLRPPYVLVENVPALANRGLDIVLGDLAACGYDAEWDCIGACCVGAPHRRLRLFLLAAHPERGGIRDEPWRTGRPGGAYEAESPADGSPVALAHPDRRGFEGLRIEKSARLEGSCGREPDGRGGDRKFHDAAAVAGADALRIRCDRRPREQEAARAAGIALAQGADAWAAEPDVGRVAHGVPHRVDRLRCLGNAVVPAQAAKAWEILIERIASR